MDIRLTVGDTPMGVYFSSFGRPVENTLVEDQKGAYHGLQIIFHGTCRKDIDR